MQCSLNKYLMDFAFYEAIRKYQQNVTQLETASRTYEGEAWECVCVNVNFLWNYWVNLYENWCRRSLAGSDCILYKPASFDIQDGSCSYNMIAK